MKHDHTSNSLHQPAWAAHLAQRLPVPASTVEPVTHPATTALTALVALFDRAQAQVNEALARTSRHERVLADHQNHHHLYDLSASAWASRSISIFPSLKEEASQVLGGALIGTSQSPAAMYVVPSFGGTVRWLVQPSQEPLTSRIIDDLFLAVFTDDPPAIARLSPLSGLDLFTTAG